MDFGRPSVANAQTDQLIRLIAAATFVEASGIECHAGHGLTFENVGAVAAITQIVELNIGHFLVGEAIFTGLAAAVSTMKSRMASHIWLIS